MILPGAVIPVQLGTGDGIGVGDGVAVGGIVAVGDGVLEGIGVMVGLAVGVGEPSRTEWGSVTLLERCELSPLYVAMSVLTPVLL